MAPTPHQRQQQLTQLATSKKRKKARVQRYLKSIEPSLVEPTAKNVLLFRGMKCSNAMVLLLRELRSLYTPHAKLLGKNNAVQPMDVAGQGVQSVEFLCTKNDCSIFVVASNNKKRPNNLMIGRTFDHAVLDMAELGILRFKSMRDYGGVVFKKRIGSKPLLLFVGDIWQGSSSSDYRHLQNLLTDLYRGDVINELVLTGLDHIMVFTASEGPAIASIPTSSNQTMVPTVVIHQRTYHVQLKKNNSNIASGGGASSSSPSSSTSPPVPYLEPCGPDIDFVLRRTQWAAPDLYKASRPKQRHLITTTNNNSKKMGSKRKNISSNMFGEQIGRLHVPKQTVDARTMGRKSKALRRAEQRAANEEATAIEQELAQEVEELD